MAPPGALERMIGRFWFHLLAHHRTEGVTTHQPRGNALGKPVTHPQPSPEGAKPALVLPFQGARTGVAIPGRCPSLMSHSAFGAHRSEILEDHERRALVFRVSPHRFLSPVENDGPIAAIQPRLQQYRRRQIRPWQPSRGNPSSR